MASTRTDDSAFGDVRFVVLAKLCGLADEDHARGKVERLWRQCTHEQTYVLGADVVDAILGERGSEFICTANLGEPVEGGIRIKGTKGRIEWLGKLRKNSKKGGAANKAKRTAKKVATGEPNGYPSGQPSGIGAECPLVPVLVPSPSEIPELPPARAPDPPAPEPAARTALGDSLWAKHKALRERLHAELRLADKLQTLHDFDPGRSELAARILERPDAASEACEHVLAVGEAEARAKGSLQWLDGGIWRLGRFSRMLAMSPADARRMPQRSAAPYDPEARRPKPRKVG